MNDDQTKAELRQIEKSIERDEEVERLKTKHSITGTRAQQKEKIHEKRIQISDEEEL